MSNRTTLAYTCADGASFYTCTEEATNFVGCCKVDPCARKGICPDDDLRAASFNKDDYKKIPKLQCDSESKNASWYVCSNTARTFMGCCTENPCGSDGGDDPCPQENLVAATLPLTGDSRNEFLNPNGTAASASDNGGLSPGATAGIAVGAVVGGLIILGFLIWRFCVMNRRKKQDQEQEQQQRQLHKHKQQQQQYQQHQQPQAPTQPYVLPIMSQFVSSEPPFTPGPPATPGPPVTPAPADNFRSSLNSNPVTPYHPNGIPDMYGKVSPLLTDERPYSVANVSDLSAASPVPFTQVPSPVQMNPVPVYHAYDYGGSNSYGHMSTGQDQRTYYGQR